MRIVGYTDRLSVQPGETISFMVSCELPTYHADIVRLIHGDINPDGPGFKEEPVETSVSGGYQGRKQTLSKGSYAAVPDNPVLRLNDSFTIQTWVYATTPEKGVQSLVAKWSASNGAGYDLFIDEGGQLTLRVGDGRGKIGRVSIGQPLRKSTWYFVAASYDSERGTASLYQEPVNGWSPEDFRIITEQSTGIYGIGETSGPLMIGGHFNGKIDSPRLFGRTLSSDELHALKIGASPRSFGQSLIAAWDFSKDISSTNVVDTSPHLLHGQTVNMPTRAMTGYNWTGNENDFKHAPNEYGAIYFHGDDLDDAKWNVDFQLTIPEEMRSGVYAACLRAEDAEDYVPFFVRPKRGTATSNIAFLVPTLSYLAYANEHVMEHLEEMVASMPEDARYPVQIQDKYTIGQGLVSLYDIHTDNSGVCYSSRLRPNLTMRPKYVMQELSSGRGAPHQLNADLHLVDWLEAKGHQHDVITDEDLHWEGFDLLASYKVIVTGSHPEYWTRQMLDALETYLQNGGRLMYLGGNGFYWVTSIDPEGKHTIEVRRWSGTKTWQAAPGEYYHSTTGELGGPWRFRGWAPQRLVGVGFTSQGFDRNSPYRRQTDSFDPRAAFIFEGIGKDELIGDFPSLVMNYGAGGFELDRVDYGLGTPPHTLLLATATGFSDSYQHVIEEVLQSDSKQGGSTNPLVKGDMVYFRYPNEGAVFSVGSISWCGSLSYNGYENSVSRITDNVLHKFASDVPLP